MGDGGFELLRRGSSDITSNKFEGYHSEIIGLWLGDDERDERSELNTGDSEGVLL